MCRRHYNSFFLLALFNVNINSVIIFLDYFQSFNYTFCTQAFKRTRVKKKKNQKQNHKEKKKKSKENISKRVRMSLLNLKCILHIIATRCNKTYRLCIWGFISFFIFYTCLMQSKWAKANGYVCAFCYEYRWTIWISNVFKPKI